MKFDKPSDYYIWEYRFMARKPDILTRSEYQLKVFGTVHTGDRGIDQMMQNQWITCMLNIDEMVELRKKDIPIKIVYVQDTKTIYECVSYHLQTWLNKLSQGMNVGQAPIDDLIAMDRFANEVYEFAKYQFTKEIVDSVVVKNMESIMAFPAGASDMFNDNRTIEEKEKDIPRRESLSGSFKTLDRSRRSWS
jgi:hypothetical protein